MVSTPLKHISQLGLLFPNIWENVPNQQPVYKCINHISFIIHWIWWYMIIYNPLSMVIWMIMDDNLHGVYTNSYLGGPNFDTHHLRRLPRLLPYVVLASSPWDSEQVTPRKIWGGAPLGTLWLCQNSYWNLPFIVDLPIEKWWSSKAMLVYHRVCLSLFLSNLTM